MELAEKLKETALSVLPVAAAVLVLGVFVAGFPAAQLGWFAAGSALVVLGLTVFLMGVELGVSRIGERTGAALTARRSLPLMAGVAFAVGLAVTVAEPDIQVFADQVRGVLPQVGKWGLTSSIALGVGAFLMLGVVRMLLAVPLKLALAAGYGLAFGLMALAPEAFAGVAFDAGGATTGPLTVPFVMALGLGVSNVRGGRDGGFGLTGVASIGPVAAVLAYALALGAGDGAAGAAATGGAGGAAGAYGLDGAVLRAVAGEVAVSALPLYAVAVLLQLFLLRMTRRQFLRATVGFALAAFGLFVFFAGVRCGFMDAGRGVGLALGRRMADGGFWLAATMAVAAFVGAAVVCAEPAVWILGEQVERVSGGVVGRRALLVFLAAATGAAVAIAGLRAAYGFSLWMVLVPGYALAIGLMPFTPGLFTGMAFDSGGVASGPLTAAFILPFTLGLAEGSGGAGDAFGVIALVAMMPLLAIQAMGLAIEARRRRGVRSGVGKEARSE